MRELEKYLLQNSQEQVSEVARWQEQEGGLKFQQSNSSSKNGEENEWGGVLLIPQKAKRGHLDECQVLVSKQESESLGRGRPS